MFSNGVCSTTLGLLINLMVSVDRPVSLQICNSMSVMPEAVTLPPSAVRIDRPQPYVLRLQGERIVSQPVRTGERGRTAAGERLEIVEGLQAGDRVVAGTVSGTAEGAMWRSAPGPGSPGVARPAGR